MQIKLHHPHDNVTKRMLADIEVAKSLIKSHIGTAFATKIAWESLQLTNKSFVSEELRELHSDLIYKCIFDKQKAYIYIVLEHSSKPKRLLPFQMLTYNVELMKQHLNEKHKKLPIIINLCLYAGKKSPYPYATDLFDCFKLPKLAKERMFKPIELIDLTVLSQEELLKDKIAGLAKVLLKQGIARDYLHWIKSNKKIIAKLASSSFGISAIIYILGTDEVNDQKTLLEAIIEASPQNKEVIMTAAQRLIEQGMQQGMQQGIQQGMQRGILQGKLDIAKSMLKEGCTISLIVKVTNLSRETIEELKK